MWICPLNLLTPLFLLCFLIVVLPADEADPISRAADIESEALGTVPFVEAR